MKVPNTIELAVTGFKGSVRLRLLAENNPEVVRAVLSALPLETFLLHVVVAGDTIYLPSPTMTLAAEHMVKRRKGVVYYNTTSQSICLCYGDVTESTLVNQFAQVIDEDFPRLVQLGRVVLQETIHRQTPTIVKVTLQHYDSRQQEGFTLEKSMDVSPGSIMNWKVTRDLIIEEANRLRKPEEPADIRLLRLGVTKSKSGGEHSPFPSTIFLQGFLSTLGPHVFSRLLAVADDSAMTLPLMVRQTRAFLVDVFDHFTFLGDLGLRHIGKLGKLYNDSLDSLDSLEAYKLLTDSMRTLIQMIYRWVHLIFPWYLKDQFRHRTEEETVDLPTLPVYQG